MPPSGADTDEAEAPEPEHSLSLTLQPKIGLEISLAADGQSYLVTGPSREWIMLEHACGADAAGKRLHVRARLSSVQPITLPPETHEAAAIPAAAVSFAFSYPAQFAISTADSAQISVQSPRPAESVQSPRRPDVSYDVIEPIDADVESKRRGLLSRSRSSKSVAKAGAETGVEVDLSALTFVELDGKLAALNLADETWAFFLLVGGFLFFDGNDAESNLVQINALTLVPSDFQLHFQGPSYPSRAALGGLQQMGRMVPVTLDALEAAGFAAFGWAHAAEAPGGHRLDEHNSERKIEHGAFVYEMRGADPTYFQLVPHTKADIAKFDGMKEERRRKAEKGPLAKASLGDLTSLSTKDISSMGSVLTSSVVGSVREVREVTLKDLMQGKPLVNTMAGSMSLSKRQLDKMQSEVSHYREANAREEAEMHTLTKDADLEGQRLSRRHDLLWLRVAIVWLGALPVLLVLISLAHASSIAFELLSCLLWSACFVFIAWVPLRDTSALAVSFKFRHAATSDQQSDALALRTFRLAQLGTPFVLAALSALSQTGLGRVDASLVVDVLGKLIVYVLLPLGVYLLRKRRAQGSASTAAPPPPNLSTPAYGSRSLKKQKTKQQLVWTQLEAATRLQANMRARRARRKVVAELAERKRRLSTFDTPIFLAALFDLIGNTIVMSLIYRGVLSVFWFIYSLAFALPSIVICVRDLRRDDRPRFSLTHGVFFVAVLYRLGFKAAFIDSISLEAPIANYTGFEAEPGALVDVAVPLLTMSAHLMIFILVTTFGKLSLNLVATPNAAPHLIFPFQFFDFVFLYSFFSLRSMDTAVTSSWIAQQVLLQANIVMRNSGSTEAFIKRYLGGLFSLLLCQLKQDKLKEFDPNEDPLIRLQYLARLGWQFDLADVAALLATPTIVSLVVWRDGFYTLEGTSILVRECELGNVWVRFGLLLFIKPAASTLARMWLRVKMRRTLLGKKTMHGTSRMAAKIIAERSLKVGGTSADAGADRKIQEQFDFKEEELAAVQEELSLSGLNFGVLRAKQMKKWRFFLATVCLQLFSAFPYRYSAPAGIVARWSSNGTTTVAVQMESLPLSSSWFYVRPDVAMRVSVDLQQAFEADAELVAKGKGSGTADDDGPAHCEGGELRGWAAPDSSDAWLDEVAAADVVLNTIDHADLIERAIRRDHP